MICLHIIKGRVFNLNLNELSKSYLWIRTSSYLRLDSFCRVNLLSNLTRISCWVKANRLMQSNRSFSLVFFLASLSHMWKPQWFKSFYWGILSFHLLTNSNNWKHCLANKDDTKWRYWFLVRTTVRFEIWLPVLGIFIVPSVQSITRVKTLT